MGKKGGGGRRRQGFASWLINIFTLILAFFRPIQILAANPHMAGLGYVADEASMGLLSGKFNKDYALRFYGPMAGALLFKSVASEVSKRAKVQSIIPALHG